MANKPTASPGSIVSKVTQLVTPIIDEQGLLLWDVRFVKEGADWILRVVIDREDEPVSINECVAVSRKLSPILDEADPIPQSYCLEVTSPGAARELTRPAHFTYYEGWPVSLKLYCPDENGQREVAGLLVERAEDGRITLQLEDETLRTFEKKAVAAVHAIDEFADDDEPAL